MSAITFAEFETGVQHAEDHVAHGRWRPALDLYGDLLSRRVRDLRFDAAALTDTDLLVLERVADIAVPLGETDAADALYAVACDRHRDSDPQRYVHAAAKRVLIALAADRFDEAMRLARALEPALGSLERIECSDEGLAAWEAARPWDPDEAPSIEAQLYLTLGRLLAGMGQYRDACALYRRGLRYTGDDRPPLARQARTPLRLAVASATLQRGGVADAGAILAEIVDAKSRPGDAVRWHELDAAAAILTGEFGRAEQAIAEAADICRVNGFTHALAGVLLARAKLLIVINQVPEAGEAIAEAQQLATILRSPVLVRRASRLADFARLRRQTLFGDALLAAPVARLQTGVDAETAIPGQAVPHEVVSWRPADFFAYYEERELELMATADAEGPTARRDYLLDLLIADFAHADSPLLRARLRLLQGVARVQARAWSAAQPCCAEAAEAFAALNVPADEYVARRFEGLCAEHVSGAGVVVFALRARAQHLLETLTTAMSADARDAYLVNKWSQREAELADTVGRLVEERRQFGHRTPAIRWLARLAWCSKVGALHLALATGDGSAPAAAGGAAWMARFKGLLAIVSHPRDAQSVMFASLPNGMVRVTVRSFHCDLDWRPVSRGRMRALVGRFHELIATGNRAADARADAAAEELGRELQLDAMLRGLPARVRRLTIFPDDQLHAFPFAALPVASGDCIVDRWAVTIGVRRLQPGIAAGHAPQRVTVAATRGGAAWRDLPESAVQSRWLTEWWLARGLRPEQLSDADCNASRFLAALASSRVFHFSGHGSFNPNAPDETGVVVRGPGEDGCIISIAKLASVRCPQLQLATFFSCWSADSFLFPGQWAVSMPITLCRAGARAVVAPLWEIEDRLSTELLQGVYDRVETMRIDEAVRLAQIQARVTAGGRRRSPFFWAGLQVYGDSGRLSVRPWGGSGWRS